jgi:hypothetical protein
MGKPEQELATWRGREGISVAVWDADDGRETLAENIAGSTPNNFCPTPPCQVPTLAHQAGLLAVGYSCDWKERPRSSADGAVRSSKQLKCDKGKVTLGQTWGTQ